MEVKIFGKSCRLEIIIISIVVGIILGVNLFCSCRTNTMESMENMGSSLDDNMGDGVMNSWINKADDYAKSMGNTETQKKWAQYQGTPVPLPEGQLYMFADNEFKPECCPSTYSSSTGCACITTEQVNYINERGGNRTIAPAEY
jgi:hypothetical protein